MISVSILVEEYQGDIERLITAAAQQALNECGVSGEISITVVDDDEIWRMNREYRAVDRPTDVLSFPSNEGFELVALPDGFLGDIAISLPRALEQAREYGHSAGRELSFLAIHGTLHLLGYDHLQEQERLEMERMQEQILNGMGIIR
ncbi:MAG: rRNA maturation RNase YbeY [Clostridia bacterium]